MQNTVTKSCGRKINLFLIRHGEAESQEKEAKLSETGRLQAKEAALHLLLEIERQGGGLIKLIHSPTRRAKETFDILLDTIRREVETSKIPVSLCSTRVSRALEAGGVIGPLMKRGIPYDQTVEYWLEHPNAIVGKSPTQIAERGRKIIRVLKRLANRLPSGKQIFYVGVTHEIPQAGLLHQVTGAKLSDLGGGIRNCEYIRVEFGQNPLGHPRLTFRDTHIELP